MPADPSLPFSSPSAPDQPSAALFVDQLTFRYRDRPDPSIVDISLQVGVGELVLLAGASGSGKTTLIRCINGLSMLVRVFSISTATILIPYVLNPAQYGVAFHGMGLPDKFAYAMDLTMRFIPTYGRDFQLTLDAQRARGLELDNVRGGLVAQVRKMVPLVVPVTIHAIIGSEDIIDAMDLRAFGVGKRTLVDELHYRKIDRLIIVLSVIMLVLSISFSLFGFGKFWVPTELISRFPVL